MISLKKVTTITFFVLSDLSEEFFSTEYLFSLYPFLLKESHFFLCLPHALQILFNYIITIALCTLESASTFALFSYTCRIKLTVFISLLLILSSKTWRNLISISQLPVPREFMWLTRVQYFHIQQIFTKSCLVFDLLRIEASLFCCYEVSLRAWLAQENRFLNLYHTEGV